MSLCGTCLIDSTVVERLKKQNAKLIAACEEAFRYVMHMDKPGARVVAKILDDALYGSDGGVLAERAKGEK